MRTLAMLSLLACGAPTTSTTDGASPDDTHSAPVTDTDRPIEDTDGRPAPYTPPVSAGVHVSEDLQRTYVLDEDLGAVVVYDDNSVVDTVPVGERPTRMVRLGREWFVTVRGEDHVVRLAERDGTLVELGRRRVGAEPTDIVASRNHARLYAALSQEHVVVALDPTTLAETARWPFAGEVAWLATSDLGDPERLVALRVDAPIVHVLDLDGEEGVTRSTYTLPPLRRFDDPDCKPRDLTPRITGSPALAGFDRLFVPGVYLDLNLSQPDHAAWRRDVLDLPEEELLERACEDAGEVTGVLEQEPICGEGYDYGCIPRLRRNPDDVDNPSVIGLYNAAVAELDLVTGEMRIALVNGRVPSQDEEGGALEIARGVPSALAWSFGRELLFITMPSQGAVIAMDPAADQVERDVDFFSFRKGTLPLGAGPSAVVVDERADLLAVWSSLERRLYRVELSSVAANMSRVLRPASPRQIITDLPWTVPAPTSPLPASVQRGRLLFHSANLREIAGRDAGVACQNCHPDGRTDGAAWIFPDFPRNTPTLAGGVHQTGPYRWLGDVGSLVDEILGTANDLMGGALSQEDAEAIADYLATVPAVRRPAPGDPQSVTRGATLFAADCATCHAGSATTDGQAHLVPAGHLIDTPTLRGVATTGPWRHDGSAATLADLLATEHATGAPGYDGTDLGDLVSYLQTL